MEPKGGYYIIP